MARGQSGTPSGRTPALGLVAAIEQHGQAAADRGEPGFDVAGNITTERNPVFNGSKTAIGVYSQDLV
jgi:hypothetical protein